jgi:hypothetical protein
MKTIRILSRNLVAMVIYALVAAATLALHVQVVYASEDTYTVSANTCQIDPLYEKRASIVYGGVRFASGQTGSILLYCSIPTIERGFPNRLELVYTDPDGTRTSSGVSAEFVRQPDTGGFVDIASLNSNSFSTTTATVQGIDFEHRFDQSHNSYYVRILISRTTTSRSPEFRAVRIIFVLI